MNERKALNGRLDGESLVLDERFVRPSPPNKHLLIHHPDCGAEMTLPFIRRDEIIRCLRCDKVLIECSDRELMIHVRNLRIRSVP